MADQEDPSTRLRELALRSLQEGQSKLAVSKSSTVWVGFSGGVDSTALLHMLVESRFAQPGQVRAIHVNHGLSETAEQWETHCQLTCEQLSVPLETKHVSVASEGNLEANARQARYEAFAQFVGEEDCVVTAHHADDAAETILLKLFQGRALDELPQCGLVEGIRVIRPLLQVKREALVAYARQEDLQWIEDESNADLKFDRNFLRAKILPKLQARWPDLDKRMSRVVRSVRGQRLALRHEVQRFAEQGLSQFELPEDKHAAIELLRLYVEVAGHFTVSDVALKEFLDQIENGRRAQVRWVGGGLRLVGDHIQIIAADD